MATVCKAPRLPALQRSPVEQLRSPCTVNAAPQQSFSCDHAAASVAVSRRQLLAAATAAAAMLSAATSPAAQADDFTKTASGLLYLDVREGETDIDCCVEYHYF